jgi:alkylation response protein AidB-like acyl-CoA dehydrogenase
VDFSLSADQREVTEAATAFARRELNQDLVKREDAGEFPREAWRKCAKSGIQGLPVPAELHMRTRAERHGDHYLLEGTNWEAAHG